MRQGLRRDEKGASAIEFALAAPVMLMFIIGIAQLGMLCMADAGLKSAVAEGARAASLYPTPEDDETILARIEDAQWGMRTANIEDPEIVRAADEDGCAYIEISMSYEAPLNFAFLELDPVELNETRRVYVQGDDHCVRGSGAGGSSASSTTSATSSGSTGTSSGSTSTGSSATSSGSTSTGSTSTSTSTSSTSTGSTSTGSTSTSSTSTSSGNASSGNNNGSSGHDHGGSSGNGSSGH